MKIINSEERAKMVTGVKVVIFGPYGIGKTSLLKTLDESTTLCLDFEAGLLAVQDWKGDSTEIRTWNEARDIACLIGGPNPAVRALTNKLLVIPERNTSLCFLGIIVRKKLLLQL